jgi:hypothetical protein
MKYRLSVRRQRFTESKVMLAQSVGKIRKANAVWKIGFVAQTMTRAAGMTEDEFMQRIRTETSMDSVQSSPPAKK